MRQATAKIFGQVQDVNFRWETQKLARRLKLTGFVRNEPDGSVYVEAEGTELALEEFFRWCRTGPTWASVERMEIEYGEPAGYDEFNIQQ